MYIDEVVKRLELHELNSEMFDKCAQVLEDVISCDGLIYIFGCGHSHMMGEEFFYRAGGLANVRPIFYEPIMLHQGAMQSSNNERKNDYVVGFLKKYDFKENDCLLVVSTSGINPVPIDVALYVKGICPVITISSFEYKMRAKSRHQAGWFLSDVGDVNLDSLVGYGDAIFGSDLKFSPVSTIISMGMIHEIVSRALMSLDLEVLPVFLSGNIESSDDHNKLLVNKYGSRVPELVMNLE